MIAKVRERKDRLDLPIVSGKHLRKISDRTALQSADTHKDYRGKALCRYWKNGNGIQADSQGTDNKKDQEGDITEIIK